MTVPYLAIGSSMTIVATLLPIASRSLAHEQHPTMPSLDGLSEELLVHILSYLPTADLVPCLRLNSRFHQTAGDLLYATLRLSSDRYCHYFGSIAPILPSITAADTHSQRQYGPDVRAAAHTGTRPLLRFARRIFISMYWSTWQVANLGLDPSTLLSLQAIRLNSTSMNPDLLNGRRVRSLTYDLNRFPTCAELDGGALARAADPQHLAFVLRPWTSWSASDEYDGSPLPEVSGLSLCHSHTAARTPPRRLQTLTFVFHQQRVLFRRFGGWSAQHPWHFSGNHDKASHLPHLVAVLTRACSLVPGLQVYVVGVENINEEYLRPHLVPGQKDVHIREWFEEKVAQRLEEETRLLRLQMEETEEGVPSTRKQYSPPTFLKLEEYAEMTSRWEDVLLPEEIAGWIPRPEGGSPPVVEKRGMYCDAD